MQLKIYAVGCCINEGYATQLAGCGILLNAINKIDGVYSNHSSEMVRRYSYGLGDSGQDLADLQAVRLALASIGPDFRKYSTEIFVVNQIVNDSLAKEFSNYENVVKDLCKWFGFYDDVTIKLSGFTLNDKKYIAEAMILAEDAAVAQKQSDSGTGAIGI